jgi:signal transduction histidine kinase
MGVEQRLCSSFNGVRNRGVNEAKLNTWRPKSLNDNGRRLASCTALAPSPDARDRRARRKKIMAHAVVSDFRTIIAQRIEAAHQILAARWLEQLKRLLPVAPDDIFPGDRLLGHIPALILELAAFFRAPAEEAIEANASVTARATELGQLRHAQRASVHQVLREYRALRGVIAQFIEEEAARLHLLPSVGDVFELTNRLDAAIDVLLQTTVNTFMAEYTETITQHTARLESFNRMVTHELRQPLGTLQFAVKLLGAEDTWTNPPQRDRLVATCERNVTQIGETLGKLVALLRTPQGTDNALVQRVELAAMIGDVVTQLREMAEARDVHLQVATSLPAMTVDAARLELVLVNLISNAIKYCDPGKSMRLVEIDAVPSDRPDICTIRIRDNGIGIAEPELRSIFARFYRGHPERDRELGTSGLGLGLSIVADCVDALKGDIRVESTLGEGTTFFLELPLTSA